MAYRRKRYYRKRSIKRRKGFKRRRYGKRRFSKRTQKYHFKRTYSPTVVTTGPSTGYTQFNGGTITISLNSLPNFAEFTNLYDEYRINCVVLKFMPILKAIQTTQQLLSASPSSQSTLTTNLGWYTPQFHWARDYDDAIAPTSLTDIQQRESYKVRMFDKPITIKCRPACALTLFRTGVASGYSAKWKTWIDEINPDVPHYCLKWGIDGVNTQHNFVYQISATFYVSFRGTK